MAERQAERGAVLRALSWAVLGFLLAASVLLFPVGLLALPLVVWACRSLAARGPHGLEVLALGLGAAAFTGLVAMTVTREPCGPSPDVAVLATGESQSCGGAGSGPFAVLTVAILLLVVLGHVIVRVRRRTSRAAPEEVLADER